ncbi:MAG: heme ABC transporter ATP-binding protein CcmA [Anaerolineaceae bacterium]|nr:heme ABC transporter ATP-binding protein CcmA [Anaerolineaceae bacterium]
MIHLRSVALKTKITSDAYPFSLPLVQNLDLTFRSGVTILVGENGSGKSTLLEAIAAAVGSITIGSQDAAHDPSLDHVRSLADTLKLTWNKRTRRGFFMRSEDFFGYAKRMNETRAELLDDLQQAQEDYKDKPAAKGYASMAYAGQLHTLKSYYGDGLDAQSHGESFLKLFQSRFVPDGLYIIDEPEAPLSPNRQLSLISLMSMAIQQNAQFIIATHSPILMAYPGAEILSCDGPKLEPIAYDDIETVSVMRSFLENPDAYLRHLVQ